MMTALPTPFLHAAGALMVLVSSANLFAPKKFNYAPHLKALPPVMRQVFVVQNCFMMAILSGFAGLCFFFADELASGLGMGRAICGFLALFWAVRTLLQFTYYDRETRRANRGFDVLFIVADSYLAIAFALAALLPLLGDRA